MSSYASFGGGLGGALIRNRQTQSRPAPESEWKYADNSASGSAYLPDWLRNAAMVRNAAMGGSGSSGGGGYGGGNPIFSDPGYEQLLAGLRAAGALDAAERQRLIQTSLIRFGLIPENLKDPYGDVTDLVRKLAGEKTQAGLSTYARIQDWNKQTLARLRKALAARGALRSGELGYGLGRQDLGYRQTFDDAVSQLLDYISGAQYAFAQSELARANQQAQAAFSAASNYAAYPSTSVAVATPRPATSATTFAAQYVPDRQSVVRIPNLPVVRPRYDGLRAV